MSTKNKAQVQQEARAIDDNVDEKENTSPARRLDVDDETLVTKQLRARTRGWQ
jgi:hypothetical protein